MSRIIAILLLAGQFEVAVKTSSGYFTGRYPHSDAGVNRFLQEIRGALARDSGRFYPCIVYERSLHDALTSPVVSRIGPGTGHATSIADRDRVEQFLDRHGPAPLTARVAEQACLEQFPKDYKARHPPATGLREFYRAPAPRSDAEIATAARCEAVLEEVLRARRHAIARDYLDPPGMAHPVYAHSYRAAMDALAAGEDGRRTLPGLSAEQCNDIGVRLD